MSSTRGIQPLRRLHHPFTISIKTPIARRHSAQPLAVVANYHPTHVRRLCTKALSTAPPKQTILGVVKLQLPAIHRFVSFAPFSTSAAARQEQRNTLEEEKTIARRKDDAVPEELEEQGFAKTERASRASQVNFSARLSKEGTQSGTAAGLGEVWRLIKIARPEAKMLGCKIVYVCIAVQDIDIISPSRFQLPDHLVIHKHVHSVCHCVP